MTLHNLTRLLIASVVVVVAASCREPTAVPRSGSSEAPDSGSKFSVQVRLRAAMMQVAVDGGQCWEPGPGACNITFTAVPANYYCGGTYSCTEGPAAQPDPITVTFSAPVYQLIVYSSGAFLCSGTYGRVSAYNRTYRQNGGGGTQVEQRDFVLFDPSDCGEDGITCCGVDTLQFPGGIAKVVIEPPQPGAFECCFQFPESANAHVSYSYKFYEHRPPTAPCLTGDELLDQQAMRDMLRAEWDSSKVNDPPINRRETPGYLFEDSTGNLVSRLYQHPALDTPCESFLPQLSALPDIPLASGHTHPFAPRDTISPPICGYTTPQQYDTTTYGGASHFDIPALQGDSLPFYILDKHNIYAYPVGVTLGNAKSKVRTYPRVDPQTGCTRT